MRRPPFCGPTENAPPATPSLSPSCPPWPHPETPLAVALKLGPSALSGGPAGQLLSMFRGEKWPGSSPTGQPAHLFPPSLLSAKKKSKCHHTGSANLATAPSALLPFPNPSQQGRRQAIAKQPREPRQPSSGEAGTSQASANDRSGKNYLAHAPPSCRQLINGSFVRCFDPTSPHHSWKR